MLKRNNLAIAKAAPKEESKYVLNGILIEPQQSVVTDGHMMLIVGHSPVHGAADFPALGGGHINQSEFPAFMIPTKTALDIAKAIPQGTKLPAIEYAAVSHVEKDHVSIVTTDLDTERVFRFRKLVGKFPNWRMVVPVVRDGDPSITFDLDLLQDTLNQMKAAGVTTVTMRFKDPDSACRIDGKITETEQPVTAIVVPLNAKIAAVPANVWGPAPETTLETVEKTPKPVEESVPVEQTA